MADPDVEALEAKQATIKAEMSALRRGVNMLLLKASLRFAAKSYAIAAITLLLGALLLKPIWIAAHWLWNLY
jgi:hypothetical protein